MATLGMVTIGQAPRVDLVPEMAEILGGVAIVEHGALDGLDRSAVVALAPGPDDEVLVTRLGDGTAVRISHRAAQSGVERAVARAEADGADATLVVCTGSFEAMAHTRPVLFAENLLLHGTTGLAAGRTVGVVCPDPRQQEMSVRKWRRLVGAPLTDVADPYGPDPEDTAARAVRRLADAGVDVVVLDCMGYTEAMRGTAVATSPIPVVLARSIVARLTLEMVR